MAQPLATRQADLGLWIFNMFVIVKVIWSLIWFVIVKVLKDKRVLSCSLCVNSGFITVFERRTAHGVYCIKGQ